MSAIFKFISLILMVTCFELSAHYDYEKECIVFYSKKEVGSNERIARRGVLVKRKDARANVIILHGYGNSKFAVSPFRLFFKDHNCLTFDFRAHGESIENQICTVGHDEVYDLFAAVDYIKSHPDLKDKPIFICAPSMGASTAIEAQSIDPNLCVGMFLDAPFPSSEDIVRKGIANVKFCLWGYNIKLPEAASNWLERNAFRASVQTLLKFLFKNISKMDTAKIDTFLKPIYPVESIKKVKVPCFFVVCKNDEKISVEAVKSIYNNHPGIKRFWETNGRDHCDSVFCDPERYSNMINEFFDDILSGEIHNKEREIVIQDPDEK